MQDLISDPVTLLSRLVGFVETLGRGRWGVWKSRLFLAGGVGGSIPGGTVLKNPPANAGDARDMGSGSGSGKSHGVRSVNPLQYSCLENPRDRGAWQVTVHGVAKSGT